MKSQKDRKGSKPTSNQERVLLVGCQFPDVDNYDHESSMDELSRLVETLGGVVIDRYSQRRKEPKPSTFIGRGKAEELAIVVADLECDLVAFDHELTGTQQKNLEKIVDCRIIDRTGVILDIFSKHARTKESKNQVELASLEYLSSHLTRRWTHLERQRGGIGMRGVGERQIELDRRMIRHRISKLKEELDHTAREREIQRSKRDKFLRVAIVGYTNAGKSTLMNNLTVGGVYVDDRLFATLDSTVRIIDPKTRPPILLSDTVGFIDKLPHGLVASFRSTLAEVVDADMLLHVVDISSDRYENQMEVTGDVLKEIGVGEKPSMLVFNKADLIDSPFLPKVLERNYIDSLVVSSLNPEDMTRLRNTIFQYFERDMVEMDILIPYEDTWLQSQIHEYSKVIKKDYLEEGARFKIRIMKATANWLKLTEKCAPLA